MGRLTFDGLFCDIAMCKETPGGTFCENGSCSQRKVWERLKEYEDMEGQGRLVVLPCKVGDQIYAIHQGTTILPMVAKWYETMDGYGDFVLIAHYPPIHKTFRFADFGKTVFLAREEAERALAGGAANA
jgi:hypothetical protein